MFPMPYRCLADLSQFSVEGIRSMNEKRAARIPLVESPVMVKT